MSKHLLKVLVTGGGGFIGSHVVEQLLGRGHAVWVLDNFSGGRRSHLPEHAHLQILEADVLTVAPSHIPVVPDVIVHLAARPSVVVSWEQPYEAHQANLSAIMKVIEWRRRWGTPRIVWASSAAVYGDPGVPVVDESLPAQPLSPYGLQKRSGEQILELFAAQDGFEVISLRLFNVFGPRQDPASPYSGVISLFVRQLLSGEDMVIFGDGEQTRDFVFVEDVARAFVAAVETGTGGCATLNIATGQACTVKGLAEQLGALRPDWPGKILHRESRPGEIRHSCADIGRAERLMSYHPETALADGLRKTFLSLKNNGNHS